MDWSALRVSLWLGAGTIIVLLPFGIWFGRVLALRHFRGKLRVDALVTDAVATGDRAPWLTTASP